MPVPEAPLQRCPWPGQDPEYIRYHDQEWGVPVHDDRLLFEFLILEGMQAGLSWITILKKRDCFRKVFDGFHAEAVARYRDGKVGQLLKEPGIIRNRLKIEAAIANAKAFLAVQKEFGSFDRYLWQFTHYKTKKKFLSIHEGRPFSDRRLCFHEPGIEKKRFQICRIYDLLCFYAGHRDGQRSFGDVFPV